MASLNPENKKFNEIRIILCVQGYSLEENRKFVPREIGFWSPNQCGVVPFNCRISYKKLSLEDKKSVKYLSDKFHGIKLNKKADYGLLLGECIAALKTLYHSVKINDKAKYIGYCRDGNIFSLLCSAGLSHLAIDLDTLDMFREKKDSVPSNSDLRLSMKNDESLTACKLHDELESEEIAICARAKAKFLGNYCINIEKDLSKS